MDSFGRGLLTLSSQPSTQVMGPRQSRSRGWRGGATSWSWSTTPTNENIHVTFHHRKLLHKLVIPEIVKVFVCNPETDIFIRCPLTLISQLLNSQTGYGPETITVAGVERGRYFLVVEHFEGDRLNDEDKGRCRV